MRLAFVEGLDRDMRRDRAVMRRGIAVGHQHARVRRSIGTVREIQRIPRKQEWNHMGKRQFRRPGGKAVVAVRSRRREVVGRGLTQ